MILGLLAVVGVAAAAWLSPVPQDPAYHRFADTRTIVGLPNFWNVVSNVGFLPVALFGIARRNEFPARSLRPAFLTFCIGTFAVGLGSSWYHYEPTVHALVWDRLPMSVAFMALFSIVVADRISQPLGNGLLWPLVAAGAGSVLYWYWTERHGAGDLRAYGLVQFLPMLLMPVMLLICPGSRGGARWLWLTFAAYLLAKAFEHFDAPIYRALGMSGHSIKHALAALAVLFAVFALLRLDSPREPRPVS